MVNWSWVLWQKDSQGIIQACAGPAQACNWQTEPHSGVGKDLFALMYENWSKSETEKDFGTGPTPTRNLCLCPPTFFERKKGVVILKYHHFMLPMFQHFNYNPTPFRNHKGTLNAMVGRSPQALCRKIWQFTLSTLLVDITGTGKPSRQNLQPSSES